MTVNQVASLVNIENVERKIDSAEGYLSNQFWSKRMIVQYLTKRLFIGYKSCISGTNFSLLQCLTSRDFTQIISSHCKTFVQALVFFQSTRFFKAFHYTCGGSGSL